MTVYSDPAEMLGTSTLDADLFDFDLRDALDAQRADRFSAIASGMPERPGVHRAIANPMLADERLFSVADALLADEFGLDDPALLEEAS